MSIEKKAQSDDEKLQGSNDEKPKDSNDKPATPPAGPSVRRPGTSGDVGSGGSGSGQN